MNSEHKGAFKNRGGARERLIRLLPDDGQKLARYEKAIKDYTNAIQLSANDPQIFADRGYAKGEQGSISSQAHYYEEAIVDFDKAISLLSNKMSNELISKLSRAYHNRAWNKEQIGIDAVADYSDTLYQLKRVREFVLDEPALTRLPRNAGGT